MQNEKVISLVLNCLMLFLFGRFPYRLLIDPKSLFKTGSYHRDEFFAVSSM
jgi:hypothetical protein